MAGGRRIMETPSRSSNSPYFTEDDVGQVRAAFLAAGQQEGDASVSDFTVRPPWGK